MTDHFHGRTSSLRGELRQPVSLIFDARSLRPYRLMHEDFAQKFCVHFDLPDRSYREDLLRRTLYPHARLLYPLITWLDYEFFDADREFVAGVGCLGQRTDFAAEVTDFLTHRRSKNIFRRFLRVRISVARMQTLVDTVFTAASEEH